MHWNANIYWGTLNPRLATASDPYTALWQFLKQSRYQPNSNVNIYWAAQLHIYVEQHYEIVVIYQVSWINDVSNKNPTWYEIPARDNWKLSVLAKFWSCRPNEITKFLNILPYSNQIRTINAEGTGNVFTKSSGKGILHILDLWIQHLNRWLNWILENEKSWGHRLSFPKNIVFLSLKFKFTKQNRPWWNATFCCISSGSALFGKTKTASAWPTVEQKYDPGRASSFLWGENLKSSPPELISSWLPYILDNKINRMSMYILTCM